ncbi:CpsD/CapB family tyrosine-protein kinase [Planomicrobium sp. YIM 101495]|uniref:CpsD/CapB family tyrosine-protein kinase n=1 Tax=Planomicrobium sp. YIM 101495 TaxID=2665160 RepID=UPI0012B73CD6|nr:CpsD/CapB family tyrosine-protein kinase [Planomicrobium sp. YIM 101495]MTD30557.1 polysaccharide biosynthesis tyrosine autokinase [Planomicrobium sp. YIM 101495]
MTQFRKQKPSGTKRMVINIDQPQSFAAEQFRALRTNLSFSAIEGELSTIMITSAGPAEGKSTVASNLASIYAQEGKKVLLIDSDMRKPTMHYIFPVRNNLGLSTILSGHSALKNTIKGTAIPNLDLLPAGPIPPNPAELLTQPVMDRLIEELTVGYDLVIVDAPPILSFSDAQIIGNKCKNALLVVHSGRTVRDDAIKAKEMILLSGCSLLGVVMNKLMQQQNKSYFESYKKQMR